MNLKMGRSVAKAQKASKKAARETSPKPASPKPVVISRPTSPRRTEKTFGVGARRSKDIEALVDEAVS